MTLLSSPPLLSCAPCVNLLQRGFLGGEPWKSFRGHTKGAEVRGSQLKHCTSNTHCVGRTVSLENHLPKLLLFLAKSDKGRILGLLLKMSRSRARKKGSNSVHNKGTALVLNMCGRTEMTYPLQLRIPGRKMGKLLMCIGYERVEPNESTLPLHERGN